MSKKVLIISSSPQRYGNSDTLCDEFAKGAKEAGHSVEKIFLRDYEVNYCLSCRACTTTARCVQKDDAPEILDKMLAADVIVLATPVYFYSMSAQLKTLIDRTVPIYTQLTNKEFYFIITAADDEQADVERVIDALRGFSDLCLEGTQERGIIYALGVWKPGEVNSTKYMEEAREMGGKI